MGGFAFWYKAKGDPTALVLDRPKEIPYNVASRARHQRESVLCSAASVERYRLALVYGACSKYTTLGGTYTRVMSV